MSRRTLHRNKQLWLFCRSANEASEMPVGAKLHKLIEQPACPQEERRHKYRRGNALNAEGNATYSLLQGLREHRLLVTAVSLLTSSSC